MEKVATRDPYLVDAGRGIPGVSPRAENADMDHLDRKRRSKNMRAIRSKDTKPEFAVRKLIHGMGYRYRLHRKDLPGKPDLVFPSKEKAIFVHGCFWHYHGCKRGRMPKSKLGYWKPKLEGNRERDKNHIKEVKALGWETLVIWECETRDVKFLMQKISGFLDGKQ